MKLLIVFLLIVVLLLQYELWFAEGGIQSVLQLQRLINRQLAINVTLQDRNTLLVADIHGLRNGAQAIEDHARNDLGMVRRGEVFYQISIPDGLNLKQ